MKPSRALLAVVALLASSACSKENAVDDSQHVAAGIGAQCTAANDPACGVAAVCALGYCRAGCTNDAECPTGSICIGDTPPFGCQLPQDLVCNGADKKCAPPLVCGLDKTCRMPCSATQACPRNEHRCIAAACVGESEKGDGAVQMLGCTEGSVKCAADGGVCSQPPCSISTCNVPPNPGWTTTTCPDAKPYCGATGCNAGVQPEDPGPMVQVTAPGGGAYGIDATEVTRAQYLKFVSEKGQDTSGQLAGCANNTSYEPTDDWPFVDRPQHPVAFVSWCDAHAYCKWAGKRLCGKIGGGSATSTPIEQTQWDNACTVGGTLNYPYGGTIAPWDTTGFDRNRCNAYENDSTGCLSGTCESVATTSLKDCQASQTGFSGVFDLSGNVAEWVDMCEPSQSSPDSGRAFCSYYGGAFDHFGVSSAGVEATCRFSVGGYIDDFAAAAVGFRCCSDP